MKHLIILLLLFFSFSIAQSELPREIKWQKVIGWKDKDMDAYVDLKSIKKADVDGTEITRGIFLFQRKIPSVLIQPGRPPIKVSSYARIVLINCKNNLTTIEADFFFDLDRLPVVTDMPIFTNDYREDENPEVVELTSDNAIYKTMCPVYL